MSINPNYLVPIKFYDGLPPHYVALEDMKDFAKEALGQTRVKVNRLLFVSFLDMYAEVSVNGQTRIENLLRPGDGMVDESLQSQFAPTQSEQAIEAFLEKYGDATEALPPDDEWWEEYISGVPDYNSVCRPGDPYPTHRNGCAPAASGCVLGYWDDHGYVNLVDGGGSSYMGSECAGGFLKLNWCELGPAMGYYPNNGTYVGYIPGGIQTVCNNNGYSSIDVDGNFWHSSAPEDRSMYHSEINAAKPFVYTSSHPNWNYGWHTMAATGYKENLYWHYRIAHDNNAYTAKKVYFNEVSFSGSTYITTIHPGSSKQKAVKTDLQLPTEYSVSAYPNPFNPTTKISWSIPNKKNVQLNIFNTNGVLVFNKDFGAQEAGQHAFTWDAKNKLGNRMSSGVYLVQIRSGQKKMSQRITLLK
ncbi:MAG: T9SS C-terminal target domain-containing protein [Calditrichaeota bacterium]|nr:MAG: T9SS C-terminal target domain-containing protein [Calditrichota bacterium]